MARANEHSVAPDGVQRQKNRYSWRMPKDHHRKVEGMGNPQEETRNRKVGKCIERVASRRRGNLAVCCKDSPCSMDSRFRREDFRTRMMADVVLERLMDLI